MASPSATPTQGVLQNIYYKRPVGTPKSCWMCHRETNTVLWNPQDHIYVCDIHLTDSNFASEATPPAPTSGKVVLGEDELKKIKDEWEENQRKKREKQEAAAKEKEKEKPKEEGGGGLLGWISGGTKPSTSGSNEDSLNPTTKRTPPAGLFAAPTSMPGAHQRFILNRKIFAMRQTELRKKRQTSRVQAVAPRLPGVPHNAPRADTY